MKTDHYYLYDYVYAKFRHLQLHLLLIWTILYLLVYIMVESKWRVCSGSEGALSYVLVVLPHEGGKDAFHGSGTTAIRWQ